MKATQNYRELIDQYLSPDNDKHQKFSILMLLVKHFTYAKLSKMIKGLTEWRFVVIIFC